MNRNDFCEELKRNNMFSKEFENDYNEFSNYQNIIIDCLKEFHRVCEKNEINYELAWGSLLGAIRDNGIIPWDYDIDVFVPFTQREDLVSALHKDLNERFYIYCIEENEKCRHVYMRIAPKGFNCEVFHMDVFFLAGVPEGIDREQLAKRISLLSNIHSDKLIKANLITRHPFLITERIIKKLKCLKYKIPKLRTEYYSLCKLESLFKSKECIHGDAFAADYVFPTEILYPTILFKTDSGEFRIPKNYEKALKLMYGDYLSIPPLNNRIEEIRVHLHRLRKWGKK